MDRDYFDFCDDACEVREYCNMVENPQSDVECIIYDIHNLYFYYDEELDDMVEYPEDELGKRFKEYEKVQIGRASCRGRV